MSIVFPCIGTCSYHSQPSIPILFHRLVRIPHSHIPISYSPSFSVFLSCTSCTHRACRIFNNSICKLNEHACNGVVSSWNSCTFSIIHSLRFSRQRQKICEITLKQLKYRVRSWRTPLTAQFAVFRRYTFEGQRGSAPLQYSGKSHWPLAALHSVAASFSCLFTHKQQ